MQPSLYLISRLIQQFDPQMTDTGPQQGWKSLHSSLSGAVEQRVTASKVCTQGMLNTAAVTQGHGMTFTGPAAVGVVVSIREESAEQAVLHMKQRHVLVKRHFKKRGINRRGQVEQLLQIEVVTRGQSQ